MAEKEKPCRLIKVGIGGLLITTAFGIGTSVNCSERNNEPKQNTPFSRQHTPESQSTPTLTSTAEVIVPKMELYEINRTNYLSIFETSDYEFIEKDVRREPTDDVKDFVRTYEILDNGVERRGVTMIKRNKITGAQKEIKGFDGFVSEVGPVETTHEATALIFVKEQGAVSYFDPQLPDTQGKYAVGVLIEAPVECTLSKFLVDRSGTITSGLGSEIIKNTPEGGCGK